MTEQSDTPRTDALMETLPKTMDTRGDADTINSVVTLLRQLERELTALRIENDGLREKLEEGERIVLGNQRYEKVRKLNAAQFLEIYRQNIEKGIPFDDLIDRIDAQRGE